MQTRVWIHREAHLETLQGNVNRFLAAVGIASGDVVDVRLSTDQVSPDHWATTVVVTYRSELPVTVELDEAPKPKVGFH